MIFLPLTMYMPFGSDAVSVGREKPNLAALQVVDRVVGSLVDGNGVDTRRREYIS